MSLHDDIMNLPAPVVYDTLPYARRMACKGAHRDARQSAAELALAADAEIARLTAEVAALRADAETGKERRAFKIDEARHYLNEAYGFSAMSPRGKEGIVSALEILDEIFAIDAARRSA